MSGRAPWCESVGATRPPFLIEKIAGTPGRSRALTYQTVAAGSINGDPDFPTTYFYDEEEILSFQRVMRGASHTGAGVEREQAKGPGGKKAQSRLLESERTMPGPVAVAGPDKQTPHRCYGAIGNSPSEEHGEVCPVGSNSSKVRDSEGSEGGIQKLPFLLISLITMCVGISSKFHSTLLDQYVYQQYADEMIGSQTHTASDPCFHGPDTNTSHRKLVKQVQDMTSERLLYLDLTLYGLGILACLMLGMLSRTIGRKLQLFIPMLGYTIKCAGLVALVYLRPNLDWLYLPYALEGLSGNFVGILLGGFLYTSDISGRGRSRTVAMVILEGVRGGTTAALNVVVGELIEHTGFKLPAWLSLAASVSAMLLLFTLPDRKPLVPSSTTKQASTGSLNLQDGSQGTLRTWFSIFLFPAGTFDNPNVRKMFKAAFAAASLDMVAMLGVKKVQSLYLMNEPICWSSSTIGWFLFGGDLSSNLFAMLIGPALLRCLPGMTLGTLGMLSITGGCIFLATATTGSQLYFEPVVEIGRQVPMGIIRGELSRLVGPEAQGTLFASIAVLESISFALGSTFLYVYNATLAFYKGTVALLGALLLFIGACILIYFQGIWKKHYGVSRDADTVNV